MQEFEYKEEYKYLSNIMLCVTDACNLACKYCFVEQHPNYMSLQTAIDAADWTWNNYLIKKEKKILKYPCSINFFGGEPTLLFDELIKPLISYTKEKKYNDFQFGMTTNGTLLNEERIKFLYENKVGLLLSIDGYKETQDYNRPCQNKESSFDKIYNNIPYLLKYYPNLTFRSTIYKDTVKYLFKNYLFAESIGFQSYFCTPDVLSLSIWDENDIEILSSEIHKIFEYRLLQYLNNKKPLNFAKINNMFLYIKKYLLNKKINTNYLTRCGLGTTLGAIGYDGSIYGCQEFASKEKNLFYIGNIYKDGIDIEKHINLLSLYNNQIKNNCNNKNCFLFNICNEYINPYCFCPSENYSLSNNLGKRNNLMCYYDLLIFKECLATFQILMEKNNNLFQTYFKSLKDYEGDLKK